MSLIISQVSKVFQKNTRENYSNINLNKNEDKDMEFTLIDGIILLISAYAAYLSWSCNTVKNVSIPFKLFYAFFAFLFGTMYVVFYGVFKGKLTPCK